nr:homeobox protein Wariai-like [Lytechinus pictus]
MEENVEKAFGRLTEFICNTTHYIQPTYDAAMLEMNHILSSIDLDKLKEEWIAIGKQSIQLAAAAADGILKELPRLQENVLYWFQEIMEKGEQLSRDVSSRTMWTAFLLTIAFIWIISPRNDRGKMKKELGRDIEDHMILSLLNLAKASYVKANAKEVMDIVDVLRVDPNYSVSEDKMTLFLCACLGGSTSLANYFLKRGGDVTCRNIHGDSCLHLAVFSTSGSRHPTKRLVEILLKNGADPNCQNTKGDTPLHIAGMTNDTDMIQLLMLYGANPSISNFDGILPIHIAANAGYMSTAKLLMVKLENEWKEGDTPPKVTIGLLSPEKAHLVLSSRPRKIAYAT